MSRVTLVNPRGHLPPRQRVPMARRLASLDGATVYIVDVRWPYTHAFSEELAAILSSRFPAARFVLREKAGPYGEADTALWAEIEKEGDAVIMGVGH